MKKISKEIQVKLFDLRDFSMSLSKQYRGFVDGFLLRQNNTGDFMKKVPQLPVWARDRQIVSIDRVYTPSTFYMKSSVHHFLSQKKTLLYITFQIKM